MKDLTEKPILGHLLQMTIPIFVGMLFQTLYFLIDLYFVARIGDAALAGVGAAGNVTFLVIALTQVLGVGTVALISHAVGRKDQADATLVFNQSLVLSATCALIRGVTRLRIRWFCGVTSACQPGSMTVVALVSKISAGPVILSAGASESRS